MRKALSDRSLLSGMYVARTDSHLIKQGVPMSLIDKVVAAVLPLESEEERQQARERARSAAPVGGWLSMVLDHHLAIESAFSEVRNATTPSTRTAAQKALALVLTGHSLAEEAVLYPALALTDHKAHAEKAYVEQSAAKVQMAALEDLDPMSQDFLDKLEHIRGAVAHHVYEEEATWFVDLQSEDSAAEAKLAARYQEEFERYCGGHAVSAPVATSTITR
jgi:hypothetical protein